LKNERDKSWFCLIHETSSISDSWKETVIWPN
jgi:hypothetical protein